MRRTLVNFAIILVFLFSSLSCSPANPELGDDGKGEAINNLKDAHLQSLINGVLPKFKYGVFKKNNASLQYNLYTPENAVANKNYPLVLFIADTSTAGQNPHPALQTYGALVWAEETSQKTSPCYVLVPQFSEVAGNEANKPTEEAKIVTDLLQDIIANNQVDPFRIYVTGYSMGGSLAMYYNISHPGIFAAALYVDCLGEEISFDKLVQTPFTFVYTDAGGKYSSQVNAIEKAARKMGKSYTWSEWSAKLPENVQFELAATQLDKGQPINLIGFEAGTVLPGAGKGDGQMYAFDYAYKLNPVREWLFKYSLKQK